MKSFILLFSLTLSTLSLAQNNLASFKKQVQAEIVRGMEIANDDKNPIVYGEQGSGSNFKGQLDSVYWQKIGNYAFKLKAGKSASKAIESIFPTKKSQKEVMLECHSMMISIVYRALMKSMGEQKFDKVFKNLVIKSGDLKASGLEKYFLMDVKVPKSKLEVGDWVYFKNHDSYLSKHPDGAWQGENAIYVGKQGSENIYSGFGAANLDEKEMLNELLEAYNAPQSPEDKKILNDEWKEMLMWLKPNAVFMKGEYIQLNPKLFKIPRGMDPEDDLERVFAPVSKGLGYASVDVFASEWDYGVDEFEGTLIFWIEKIKPYEDKLTISDIPGISRIDRLDYKKLFGL